MSKFAETVKELLKEKKLNQKELSRMSGVSEPSLCRYLSKGIEPRMDIVNNVSMALGVSSDYLLGGESREREIDPYVETRNIVTRNKAKLTVDQKAEILKILFGDK
ncbi:MAG: helix-turn-helix transcriptional regulator [Anaeroplasma sp.]|uniref:helix-turn-helix domain-containing protein n=1 Tax=Anaeroplasma sp. TaxID=1872523 RepID=UPI002A90D747|nr:helix-turn-helix transcriptional regulator [Anaeroplasma sp.]MDY5983075.1 helix-turn-helix transcriptional regulator [Anaeroplasma sp.]